MRKKSLEKMKEILEFAEQFYLLEHRSPSTTEIAKAVGFARGTVYQYLVEMDRIGMIDYDGGEIHSPLINRYCTKSSHAPICGAVPCGDPLNEVENIEQIVPLPTQIFGDGPLFILRASGDSMVDVGIEDGDYVVIRKTTEVSIGDIVVALDQNQQNTLKAYDGINKKNGKAVLCYRNQKKYGNKKIEVLQFIVQGVAQHVIKAL